MNSLFWNRKEFYELLVQGKYSIFLFRDINNLIYAFNLLIFFCILCSNPNPIPMKYTGILLPVYLLLPSFLFAQQGSTCSNPFPLTLDGVCRDYAISSSTSNSTICSYGSNMHETFFSFTTNSSAQCTVVDITDPAAQPCEVGVYSGGSCTNGNLISNSSLCLPDGKGIWAPALYVDGVLVSPKVLQPSATYILRVRTTSTTGNLTICAQYNTPPNNLCNSATSIGSTPISDNNACNNGSAEVAPIDLAAGTLENTAFYKYTVGSGVTGSTLTIGNIDCDNGTESPDGATNVGMQVGVFVGDCSSLLRIDRFTGNNAASPIHRSYSLPPGTNVYVAIDGTSGSNCKYSLSATNSVPLPVYIKYFIGWKTSTSNMLEWVSLEELNNDHYEIQRSGDGQDFSTIGRIKGEMMSSSEKTYRFEDPHPPIKCFYRLKQVDIDNHEKIFKTIEITRTELPYVQLSFQNPIMENLQLNLQTNFTGQAELRIISLNGTIMFGKTITYNKGDNTLLTNLSSLSAGKYILSIEGKNIKSAKTLIKTNSSFF